MPKRKTIKTPLKLTGIEDSALLSDTKRMYVVFMEEEIHLLKLAAIIGGFTNKQEMIRDVMRRYMIDKGLYQYYKKNMHGKEYKDVKEQVKELKIFYDRKRGYDV